MPFDSKPSNVVDADALVDMPDLPDLPSLTDKEKTDLNEWWRNVLSVLDRNNASIKSATS